MAVLVPGTDVLLAEPDLPVKAGAKLATLVPYALEEHLADAIEDLHFAIGKRQGDGTRTRVAVVARHLMNEWLAQLRAAGIEPNALYADSDLLPLNPGQAVALLEEDAVFVRPPRGTPVTLPADALDQALEIARGSTDTSAGGGSGLILYTGAAEWQQHAAQVEAARPHFDGIKVQLLTDGPLALFAQQLPHETAINLLQGDYAPASGRGAHLKAWRVAAMLLAALLVLHIGGKIVQLRVLKSREHTVDASIRDVAAQRRRDHPGGHPQAHGGARRGRARRRRRAAAGAAGPRPGARHDPGHQRPGAQLPRRRAGDDPRGARRGEPGASVPGAARERLAG